MSQGESSSLHHTALSPYSLCSSLLALIPGSGYHRSTNPYVCSTQTPPPLLSLLSARQFFSYLPAIVLGKSYCNTATLEINEKKKKRN